MNVIIRDLDQQRILFEAMVRRAGEENAKRAFSRALTHEGRKTYTAVRRELRQQTSIPRAVITAGTKFKPSTVSTLRTVIEGRGSELPLRHFAPKQFKFGVRAKVWGEFQRYPSAFLVRAYNGDAFVRQGKARFPIKRMWGPSIAKELVKDDTRDTFERSGQDVADRAMHELSRILKV